MLVGSVFSREAMTAPRRVRFFSVRVLVVAALLGLSLTAWQLLVGSQPISGPGDLSRFGAAVFALLAPLTMTVCVLFSALLAAAAVCQEKDRKTLILLLLSDLTNSELVLGKLLASMLTVLVVIASTAPFLFFLTLLGGVSHQQVLRVLAVTLLASLVAGSLGSLVALWREKTFQALALVALGVVVWLVGGEVLAGGALGTSIAGMPATDLAVTVSPWRAITAAVQPTLTSASLPGDGLGAGVGPLAGSVIDGWSNASLVTGFLLAASAAVVVLNGIGIAMIRVWNPSREARPGTPVDPTNAEQEVTDAERFKAHDAPGRARPVWENPILWREVRTWAYGRKILVIKFAYAVIFLACAAAALALIGEPDRGGSLPPAAGPLAPLLVVSVVLVNALAVTSLTNERDGKALDLLLATDLSAKELIFGKLAGAFYNAKEMILLPLGLLVWLWAAGGLTGENLAFLALGLLVVFFFAAVLGLHSGMIYFSSRQAIGASVGTLLFLFLGVTTCMRMMLELSESFEYQLVPFLGFMFGGGVALFAALGWRNPSPAMGLACFSAPVVTFYAITSFLMGSFDLAFFATVITFGFATAAMLVPALSEFDIATDAARGD